MAQMSESLRGGGLWEGREDGGVACAFELVLVSCGLWLVACGLWLVRDVLWERALLLLARGDAGEMTWSGSPAVI